MKFLYSLGGGNIPVIREYDISARERFNKGQVVKISTNASISANAAGGCIGIAAEEHTGVKDVLNERNNGKKLRVDITRDAVYEVDAMRLTATGGSASTFVCNSGGISATLNDSKLVLVSKGANSQNTDSAGSERHVISVTVTGDSATFSIENGSIICEGDVYALIPKYGYKGYVGGSNGTFSCVSASDTTSAYVINYDTDRLTLEVMPQKDFIA